MTEKRSKDYCEGFSEGYRQGHKEGIMNKGRRDFCKTCGIDIEHAKETDYNCKVLYCMYSFGIYNAKDESGE